MTLAERIEAALGWLGRAECAEGGLSGHGERVNPFPEVTGYAIPSLLRWGRRTLAERLVHWLVDTQRPDGLFPAYAGCESVPVRERPGSFFDSAMVLLGLRAWSEMEPSTAVLSACLRCEAALQKAEPTWSAADPIYMTLARAVIGRLHAPPNSEGTHRLHYLLYSIQGERMAGLDCARWPIRFENLPFPAPYWVHVFHEVVHPTCSDVCVCGNFQYAWLFGDKALFDKLCCLQLPDGGFPSQPGGPNGIVWAAKYFLDAAAEIYMDLAPDEKANAAGERPLPAKGGA